MAMRRGDLSGAMAADTRPAMGSATTSPTTPPTPPAAPAARALLVRLWRDYVLRYRALLALVAAFGGRERVLEAYAAAVARRYRFFSYGDAMYLPRRAEGAAS